MNTTQQEAEQQVQAAIDYMIGSGNPAHHVDADWFRLKWTQAVRELIEIQTVFDESNEIISANIDLRERLALAVEAMEKATTHCFYGCLPMDAITASRILTAAIKQAKGEKELTTIEKKNAALQSKLAAAKEYVEFLEEFWGIDPRLGKNPKTQTARQKYMEAMK